MNEYAITYELKFVYTTFVQTDTLEDAKSIVIDRVLDDYTIIFEGDSYYFDDVEIISAVLAEVSE